METIGVCQDWAVKAAYTISTARTLTYCVLLFQPRWLHLVILTAGATDAVLFWSLGGSTWDFWYLAYFCTGMLYCFDYYEMTNRHVLAVRGSEQRSRSGRMHALHIFAGCVLLVLYDLMRDLPLWLYEVVNGALVLFEFWAALGLFCTQASSICAL
jgi:hypothetical protein